MQRISNHSDLRTKNYKNCRFGKQLIWCSCESALYSRKRRAEDSWLQKRWFCIRWPCERNRAWTPNHRYLWSTYSRQYCSSWLHSCKSLSYPAPFRHTTNHSTDATNQGSALRITKRNKTHEDKVPLTTYRELASDKCASHPSEALIVWCPFLNAHETLKPTSFFSIDLFSF